MKAIIAIVFAATLAACGQQDLSRELGNSMASARTTVGTGQRCSTPHRWLECDSGKTPSEAAGGSE